MQFIFEQIRTGGDRNFAYLLGDREAKEAALIDPSFDPEAVVKRATAQGLAVKYIINTHGHPDHLNGNTRAIELTGAPIAAHRDVPFNVDIELADESELSVGALALRFIYTPGHSSDHFIVYCEQLSLTLTGDLIFVGKVGGTATEDAARIEWDSLQRALKLLPDQTTIWPGHDYGCRPSSTVKLEKQMNPFLQCRSVEEFLALKHSWSKLKASHGLL